MATAEQADGPDLEPLGPPESGAEMEFRRFARSFANDGLEPEVRKLLGLIVRRFNEVAPLGTAHGKRASWIVENWEEAAVEEIGALLEGSTSAGSSTFPLERLEALTVGPFRGFVQEEVVELDKPVVFVYGPNGTGKTSLCEALEYSMLGFIEEAKAKRIDLPEYVVNLPSGEFEPPVLTAVSVEGNLTTVEQDPDAFRFCFVEKNRIDAFARMAASTPSTQAHRIALLFGLEDFSQFVDGFTEHLGRYLSLEAEKPVQMEQLEERMERHRKVLNNAPSRQKEIDERRAQLAVEAGLADEDATLRMALHGDSETGAIGRIAELDQRLEQTAQASESLLTGFERQALDSEVGILEESSQVLSDLRRQLSDEAKGVGFVRLFEALEAVRGDWDQETCPACLTPLETVTEDPFERAATELEALSRLSDLETRIADQWRTVAVQVEAVGNQVRSAGRIAEGLGVTTSLSYEAVDQGVIGSAEDALTAAGDLVGHVKEAEGSLEELETARQVALQQLEDEAAEKERLRGERDRLRKISDALVNLEAREAQLTEDVEVAKEALEEFEEECASLRKEIEEEAKQISEHQELLDAYDALTEELRAYRDILPIVLVEDLADQAIELYNLINAHDPPFDRLQELILPSQVGEDLMVRFHGSAGEESTPVNALRVLSEGHLRCLGVAILLAKNLHEGRQLMIFDDVVNAVDDDHRAGLADVLLEHPEISEKQIIITTHGREFLKTLSLKISKSDFSSAVRQIDFLVPDDHRGIVVDREGTPGHYLVRASGHLESGEPRLALSDLRRSLEAVCGGLWKRLAQKYNVTLKIRSRGMKAIPDLRSVVDSLEKFLRKQLSTSEGDLAAELAGHFRDLQDRWEELNKGTHESSDQEEFDLTTVAEILEALEQLEEATVNRWKEL